MTLDPYIEEVMEFTDFEHIKNNIRSSSFFEQLICFYDFFERNKKHDEHPDHIKYLVEKYNINNDIGFDHLASQIIGDPQNEFVKNIKSWEDFNIKLDELSKTGYFRPKVYDLDLVAWN